MLINQVFVVLKHNMPESIQKRWERIEKKVLKFNEAFPEAHVICIAVIDNYYKSAGHQDMKVHFSEADIVKNKFREVIEGQSVIPGIQNEPRVEEVVPPVLHDSVQDSLAKHCFDMDMNEIRAIITTVLSPSDRPLGTGRMRGFYKEENCPSWWRETSVPFASLNNPRAGQKRATIEDGYKLIESLQEFCQVYPPRPTKMPNSSIQFRSRFYRDLQSLNSECSNTVSESITSTSPSPTFATSTSSAIPTTSTSASSAVPTPTTSTSASSAVLTPTTSTSASSAVPSPTTSTTAPSAVPTPTTSSSVSSAVPIPTTSTSACSAIPASASSASIISLSKRREQLISLAKESLKGHCIEILRILGAGTWNELVSLAEELKEYIPAFPTSLAKEWKTPTLINTNKRFEDFIPKSIGHRTCMTTTGNGNCIFNAFSIALYGNEDEAFCLRLACIVAMADNILQYSKYMIEEFGNNVTELLNSLSGTEYPIPTDLLDTERMEYFCRQELLWTARKPFRDCTLFHIHVLSNVLQRAVVNHYSKKNSAVPFMQHIFPCMRKTMYPSSVHLVWIPVKPSRYASLRHVVPAVCLPGPFGAHVDECAFEGMSCCAFMFNANLDTYQQAVMVECTLCGQWVHDVCARINVQNIKEDDPFLCGCDRIDGGKFVIKRM